MRTAPEAWWEVSPGRHSCMEPCSIPQRPVSLEPCGRLLTRDWLPWTQLSNSPPTHPTKETSVLSSTLCTGVAKSDVWSTSGSIKPSKHEVYCSKNIYTYLVKNANLRILGNLTHWNLHNPYLKSMKMFWTGNVQDFLTIERLEQIATPTSGIQTVLCMAPNPVTTVCNTDPSYIFQHAYIYLTMFLSLLLRLYTILKTYP